MLTQERGTPPVFRTMLASLALAGRQSRVPIPNGIERKSLLSIRLRPRYRSALRVLTHAVTGSVVALGACKQAAPKGRFGRLNAVEFSRVSADDAE